MNSIRLRQVPAFVFLGLSLACAHATRDYAGVHLSDAPTQRHSKPEATAESLARASVVVRTEVGRAFGFFVDDRGHMVTNRHVIEDARDIRVSRLGAGEAVTWQPAQIVYVDGIRDLAVLRVDAPLSEEAPAEFLPLAVVDVAPIAEFAQTGQSVMVLDFDGTPKPAGAKSGEGATLPGVVVELGQVQRTDVYEPAAGPGAYVELGIDIDRGQSGGPVVDSSGRVIGIVTWTWRDKIGGYAVPISALVRSLAERPDMNSDAARRSRLSQRVREFALALDRGQHEELQRFVSPMYARAVRERVLAHLWASMDRHSYAMERFFGRLEYLLRRAPVDDIVHELTDPTSMNGIWAGTSPLPIPVSQANSFLRQFGLGYVKARVTGTQSPRKAMERAARELRSLANARHMTTATWIAELRGTKIDVVEIDHQPNLYGPSALVTVTVAHPGIGGNETVGGQRRLAVQMRVEWGDWYVSGIQELDASSGWLSVRGDASPMARKFYALGDLSERINKITPLRHDPGSR